MKLTGTYTFEAPQPIVWESLQDPTVLTSVLPGCERLEEVGENRYEGALEIKVGPVQGSFQGRIEMRDIEPRTGFTLAIDGQGATGFVRATARVALEPAGESTLVRYDSDAQVGGRIAGVGQRLLDSSAKAIIQQSLDGLHERMKATARAAAAGSAPESATPGAEGGYQAPSQAEFAARVARDVARDLVPRPVLVGGLILLAIVLLLLFLL